MSLHPLHVLIAEDQRLLRMGLAQAISNAGYHIGAETETIESTLERAEAVRPGTVLIKRDLPGGDAVQCCKALRQMLGPELALIVMLTRPSDIWGALESTANGYTLRETVVELLPHALKYVNQGLGWMGPNISHYLVSGRGLPLLFTAANRYLATPQVKALSDREQDVLLLLLDGLTNSDIGDKLGLKLETVKVHVKNILRKLKARTRAEAIAMILKGGLPANAGGQRRAE